MVNNLKNEVEIGKRKLESYSTVQYIVQGVFIALIIAGVILSIHVGKKPFYVQYKEGDVALEDVYAPRDFSYVVGVDTIKTKQLQEEAYNFALSVYDLDLEQNKHLRDKIDKFFEALIILKKEDQATAEEKKRLAEAGGLLASVSEGSKRNLLESENLSELKEITKQVAGEILSVGAVDRKDAEEFKNAGIEKITVRNPHTKIEKTVALDELFTIAETQQDLIKKLKVVLPDERKVRLALINIIQSLLASNLNYNQKLTETRKEQAAKTIPTQHLEREVKKDERIIEKGERITGEHLKKIGVLAKQKGNLSELNALWGTIIFTIIFLAIFISYLQYYEPQALKRMRDFVTINVLFILLIAGAKLITLSPVSSLFIPTAVVTIIVTLLISNRIALLLAIVLSILIGFITGGSLKIVVISLIGSVVGIYAIKGTRRRSQILKAGFMVGAANFIAICGMGLLYGLEYIVFGTEGLRGFFNGIISAVLVMGLLPLFESIFNYTTDISLLEMSDLNHPLLRKMVVHAPGTYHHSLVVSNLAEAACENIGANSLLARVGAYFHDIGKIEKAEYFSENQNRFTKRKHDKLSPSMSSLIIINHVKDGVELAKKHRLNPVIADFIKQHHGTSLIYYFYQRALEKVEEEELLKEEGFRYPGPKPQSKETAVVLLADSVEAASRALTEPTPSRIKGLVHKIINNKFIDAQLDECYLTLKDLNIIAETFIHILTGTFHSRVQYPERESKR